uniref:Uncharacterized protein n=1 Tax=Glossina palpalis gambiensis TaxID=67801 RepID=A0A1B0BI98_9MUSC
MRDDKKVGKEQQDRGIVECGGWGTVHLPKLQSESTTAATTADMSESNEEFHGSVKGKQGSPRAVISDNNLAEEKSDSSNTTITLPPQPQPPPPPSLNRRIGDARILTKRIRFNAQTYGISTQQFLWPFVFQYKGVHTYKPLYMYM